MRPLKKIDPTRRIKLQGVIAKNCGKNAPDGNFTAFVYLKSKGLEFANFNMRDIGKHQDDTTQRHNVSTVLESTFRKRRSHLNRIRAARQFVRHCKSEYLSQPQCQ